jgi:hypothetical protein
MFYKKVLEKLCPLLIQLRRLISLDLEEKVTTTPVFVFGQRLFSTTKATKNISF